MPCSSLSRGIFFVELGGATRANRTRGRFLGSSKVKKDGILASVSGVGFRFVFVCGAAMELENWIGWACSSRVSRGNPLATSPSSLLMSKLFAAKII